MAKNTGRGSRAARRDPLHGRFTAIKTNGGSFRPYPPPPWWRRLLAWLAGRSSRWRSG
jgi:hypothetical protein